MTKIKFCGLKSLRDVEYVNLCRPDYVGFVFWPRSKRFVTREPAEQMKGALAPGITAVGVFVDEAPEKVAELLNDGVIDLAQLHGSEDAAYIAKLRSLTDKGLIRAFRVHSVSELAGVEECTADQILLDSGAGSGERFDWSVVKTVKRPFFLAGGLTPENAAQAVQSLHPYALDVSSGIETEGVKDMEKMKAFMNAVRDADRRPTSEGGFKR